MQHATLTPERFVSFPFMEQLANIGSEVIRAVNWRKKGNLEYSKLALYRALELLDFSLTAEISSERRKELARVRSALVDDFIGENTFGSTDGSWNRYFMAYTYRAGVTRRVL